MAFLACVLLLAALLSPATVITGAATTAALDGAHSSSVVTKRLSRRALTDATFVAEFRRPSVARRLSAEVAQPAAASPPGDVKLAPSQLAALVALMGWEAAEMCSQWMGVTCDGRGMVTKMNCEPCLSLSFSTTHTVRSRHHPYSPPTPLLSLLHRVTDGPHLPPTLCTPPPCSDFSFSPLTGSLEFLAYLPALQYLYAPVPLHFTSPCALDPLLRTFKIVRLFSSFLPHMPARRSIAFVLSIPSYPWSHTSALNSPSVLPTHGSDLHATDLTGEIPTALGKATALSYLDFSFSPLTGSLEFLAYLPALQYL
ncbi:unnamed protein product, partial [Closterium sp. NIES-65]